MYVDKVMTECFDEACFLEGIKMFDFMEGE